MPLLSVIIPVFNGESFLDTIFDCFEQQTQKDFELIFVDDGSTDQTAARLQERAKSAAFPVTVETIEPLGVSAARNRGLELAHGQYISFVDVDDRVVPDYVETLARTASETPFELFYFQSRRVPEEGPFQPETAADGSRTIDKLAMLDRIAADPTKFGVYNLFIDRCFLEQHAFRFATGYDYYEDYDLLYRMTAAAESIRITEAQLYFYILQSGSAVATFRVERLSCVELLEQDLPYLQEHAPTFVPAFQNWVIPRIYWSVLWQACLAFSPGNALKFARLADMKTRLKSLTDYPGRKVRLSTQLFLIAPHAYVLAARLLGRSHSRIGQTDFAPFEDYFSN